MVPFAVKDRGGSLPAAGWRDALRRCISLSKLRGRLTVWVKTYGDGTLTPVPACRIGVPIIASDISPQLAKSRRISGFRRSTNHTDYLTESDAIFTPKSDAPGPPLQSRKYISAHGSE